MLVARCMHLKHIAIVWEGVLEVTGRWGLFQVSFPGILPTFDAFDTSRNDPLLDSMDGTRWTPTVTTLTRGLCCVFSSCSSCTWYYHTWRLPIKLPSGYCRQGRKSTCTVPVVFMIPRSNSHQHTNKWLCCSPTVFTGHLVTFVLKVESLTIRPERPLVVMAMTRPRRSFGLPCKLVDRDAFDWLTDDYMAKVTDCKPQATQSNVSERAVPHPKSCVKCRLPWVVRYARPSMTLFLRVYVSRNRSR